MESRVKVCIIHKESCKAAPLASEKLPTGSSLRTMVERVEKEVTEIFDALDDGSESIELAEFRIYCKSFKLCGEEYIKDEEEMKLAFATMRRPVKKKGGNNDDDSALPQNGICKREWQAFFTNEVRAVLDSGKSIKDKDAKEEYVKNQLTKYIDKAGAVKSAIATLKASLEKNDTIQTGGNL